MTTSPTSACAPPRTVSFPPRAAGACATGAWKWAAASMLVLAGASSAWAADVAPEHILAQFNPALPLSTQAWGNVQCNGLIVPSQWVPETGLNGTLLEDGSTLRFGRAPDPQDNTRLAFRFALRSSDPLIAGSFRCETAFSPGVTGLPIGSVFWHAFAVYVPDWRNTVDEQQLAQWHAGDSSGLQPIYALLVRDGQMRLVMRYSTAESPTASTVKTQVLWTSSAWQPNQWFTVVTKAKISTLAAEGPFIQTWVNGAQIVNYRGPVGYRQPAAQPYVKHGVYHWINLNAWDSRQPTRTVHFRRAALVRDLNGVYVPADLSRFVNSQ